ncbi:unnamed protein product [Ambrosiozyma monospora]|uniref:Unnamed protein product n=1 Tax=Ambrosiozyma monospora TaxID=43982 RepID=A0ACB5TIC4_AMBMO|nr:unnamed protein product [Ambrosiozyma monospora]
MIIVDDNGVYYTDNDNHDLVVKINSNYYNANDPEFYDGQGERNVVLLDTLTGTELYVSQVYGTQNSQDIQERIISRSLEQLTQHNLVNFVTMEEGGIEMLKDLEREVHSQLGLS